MADDLSDVRREGRQFTERLAVVIRDRLVEGGFVGQLLADYLSLSLRQVTDRMEGQEPWTVLDMYRFAALFDTTVSDLLEEAGSGPQKRR